MAVIKEPEGLYLPPVDMEQKEREKCVLHGDEVAVSFVFPDGSNTVLTCKQGFEVKKVKLMLEATTQVSHKKMEFMYEGKVMIDPISMSDGWGPAPVHFNVDVKLKD